METGARHAAYLSGDLDPGERAAVEAELARDPALRDRLDQVRAADEALADLPAVELPGDAQDRLHRVVGQELHTVLGDELAARRARRGLPRWVPVAAAAALVVVVGGGIALTGGGGTMSGSEDAMMAEDAPEAALDGGGQATEAGDGAASAQVGPRVVDRGRTLDERALRQLVSDADVLDALGTPEVDDPLATAAGYARALGADPDVYFDGQQGQLDTGEATQQAGAPEDQTATTSRLTTPPIVSAGDVSDAERADVARCLPILQEAASAPVVPLYAELGTDADGAEVIAYAALAPDEDGDHRRIEVWLVERSSCSVRTFMQRDR